MIPSIAPPNKISLARNASMAASSPWTRHGGLLANTLCAMRALRLLRVLLGQGLDLVATEEGEKIQVPNHVTVIDAHPVLVKLVDARAGHIQPHGAGFRFAKLVPSELVISGMVKP